MRLTHLLIVLPFLFATAAGAAPAPTPALSFESKLVEGKKLWLPATVDAKAGQAVVISVKNTLAEPHGFAIDGVVEPQVIAAGETKTFNVTFKDKGDKKVTCQLHPAHVAATVKVK